MSLALALLLALKLYYVRKVLNFYYRS